VSVFSLCWLIRILFLFLYIFANKKLYFFVSATQNLKNDEIAIQQSNEAKILYKRVAQVSLTFSLFDFLLTFLVFFFVSETKKNQIEITRIANELIKSYYNSLFSSYLWSDYHLIYCL
jgi:hypothetical protein